MQGLEGQPHIVSGGGDGAVRVWGESGQLEVTISVWDATAVVVALAPGARIVVGALGGLMVLRLDPDTLSAQTRPSHDHSQDRGSPPRRPGEGEADLTSFPDPQSSRGAQT